MPAKISLETDFVDYYDHTFSTAEARHGPVFRRSGPPLPTKEQFRILKAAGIPTPLCGDPVFVAKELMARYGCAGWAARTAHVALYASPESLTPVKAPVEQILKSAPNGFAHEWIPNPTPPSLAINVAHIQIGNRAWMSTHQRTLLDDEPRQMLLEQPVLLTETLPETCEALTKYPVFVIKYLDAYGTNLAYSLDTAPCLSFYGLEAVLPPDEAYHLIEETLLKTA